MKIIALILLLVLVQLSQALEFDLDATRPRCFIEDTTEHTIIYGRYQLSALDNEPKVQITVFDPMDKTVVDKRALENGNIVFTTTMDGAYKICVATKDKGVTYRFNWVMLEQGVDEDALENAATYKDIGDLQLQLLRLSQLSQDIQRKQKIHRAGEMTMLQFHEATDNKVMVSTVFQILVIICAAWLQFRYLKEFFESKKAI